MTLTGSCISLIAGLIHFWYNCSSLNVISLSNGNVVRAKSSPLCLVRIVYLSPAPQYKRSLSFITIPPTGNTTFGTSTGFFIVECNHIPHPSVIKIPHPY